MTTLDIIFLVIIGGSAVIGGFKGLIKTIFGFASTIVSLVAAYFLYKPFARILVKSTNIYYFLEEKIGEFISFGDSGETLSATADRRDIISGLEMPDIVQDMLLENDNSQIYDLLGLDPGHTVKEFVSGFLANLAVNALAFIILFIVAGIAIGIIAFVLDLIAKLPVLNEVNHIAGFAVGLALGVILLWVVSLGLYFTLAVQGTGDLQMVIDDSVVVPIFYNNNLLLNLLNDVTKGLLP